MSDHPAIGKAMIKDASGAIIDECNVLAAEAPRVTHYGGQMQWSFARELHLEDGQTITIDMWQRSFDVEVEHVKEVSTKAGSRAAVKEA